MNNSDSSNSDSSSISSAEESTCRICLRGPSNSLITPCDCQGAFAYVHSSCLSQWLEATEHQHCDICRFEFIIVKKSKSFYDWLCEEHDEVEEIIAVTIGSFVSLYILLLGSIISITTSGQIHWLMTALLRLGTIIWFLSVIIVVTVCIGRTVINYRQWKVTHYRVTVKPNPGHTTTQESPPKSPVRASGLRSRSTPSLSSNELALPENDESDDE